MDSPAAHPPQYAPNYYKKSSKLDMMYLHVSILKQELNRPI